MCLPWLFLSLMNVMGSFVWRIVPFFLAQPPFVSHINRCWAVLKGFTHNFLSENLEFCYYERFGAYFDSRLWTSSLMKVKNHYLALWMWLPNNRNLISKLGQGLDNEFRLWESIESFCTLLKLIIQWVFQNRFKISKIYFESELNILANVFSRTDF